MRSLPERRIGRVGDKVLSATLTATADGSVTVDTYKPWRVKDGSKMEDWGSSGSIYVLKRSERVADHQ